MNFVRFLGWFALGGALVPLLFRAIWSLVNAYQSANLTLQTRIEKLMLMLWPSSVMTLPGDSDEALSTKLLLLSIFVNVAFYVAIGVAVWFGVKKNNIILLLLAIVIVALWWRVLTL